MTKLVLITGVSRGLGLAMTERFIQEKCTVIGCARSPVIVEKLQQKFGNPHSFTQVDVSNNEQVKAWANKILTQHAPPDLLINNAGVMNQLAPLWQISADEFDRLVDVNIKGVANIIRHFVPAMIEKNHGVVVNFSSGWGRSTSPQVAPYCASKWAIEGLTRSLAQELPSKMAAIPLNPGIIHTDMLEICFGEEAADYSSIHNWVKKAVPFLLQLSAKNNGAALTIPS
jgi:NAD(P)-dependent dehydrogenase (short-subunit alcohol dehydrogenase family)